MSTHEAMHTALGYVGASRRATEPIGHTVELWPLESDFLRWWRSVHQFFECWSDLGAPVLVSKPMRCGAERLVLSHQRSSSIFICFRTLLVLPNVLIFPCVFAIFLTFLNFPTTFRSCVPNMFVFSKNVFVSPNILRSFPTCILSFQTFVNLGWSDLSWHFQIFPSLSRFSTHVQIFPNGFRCPNMFIFIKSIRFQTFSDIPTFLDLSYRAP